MKKIFVYWMMIFGITMSISTAAFALKDLPLRVVLNNFDKVFFEDAQPYIDSNSRVQVPVRFVSQALGGTVRWKTSTKTITITKNEAEIIFVVGEKKYTVNGQEFQMDTEAVIKEDRTFVPVRYISEAFGAKVRWEPSYATVYITEKDFNGHKNPVDPVTGCVRVEENRGSSETLITIQHSDDNPEILEARFVYAEKLFAQKYGESLAKELFEYARLSKNATTLLELKRVVRDSQEFSVRAGTVTVEIAAWKVVK